MLNIKVNMNPSIIREIATESVLDKGIEAPTQIDIAKEIISEYENNKAYYEARDVDMAVVAEAEAYLDLLSSKN